MWTYGLLCFALIGISQSAYSGTASAGGYAGATSGAGSGGFGTVYGSAFPFSPFPGLDNRFGSGPASIADFLQNLQNQHQSSFTMTSTTDDATAQASAMLFNAELFNQQLQHQAALFNTIQDRFGESGTTTVTGGGGGGGGSGPQYAAASASYGPGGGHQSVYINPPNPNSPNVHTRFDSSGTPGSVGISTSSFSSTADVNGVKTNRRGAVTSVNNDGKVTTYYTHS